MRIGRYTGSAYTHTHTCNATKISKREYISHCHKRRALRHSIRFHRASSLHCILDLRNRREAFFLQFRYLLSGRGSCIARERQIHIIPASVSQFPRRGRRMRGLIMTFSSALCSIREIPCVCVCVHEPITTRFRASDFSHFLFQIPLNCTFVDVCVCARARVYVCVCVCVCVVGSGCDRCARDKVIISAIRRAVRNYWIDI